MNILAIASFKWDKVKVWDMPDVTVDRGVQARTGEWVVQIVNNTVVHILGPADAYQRDVVFTGEDNHLYSRFMGIWVDGQYPNGKYEVMCPTWAKNCALSNEAKFIPYKPSGECLVRAIEEEPLPMEDAILRGKLFGKVEEEITRLTATDDVTEYISALTEILEDAPLTYKESNAPLLSALKYAVALKKGAI